MIIVTLTTIPSRVKHLQPVIDNILSQSFPPDRIELYIPKEYKKRSLGQADLNDLPNGCEVIHCDEDYGPATKILPALQRYTGKDVTLIYCDDDRIYDKNWIKRLVTKSREYPNDCITENGFYFDWYFVKLWQSKKKLQYRLRRILSLGLWNPKRKILSTPDNICDIAEGYGGVLVKPDFFSPEVIDIPDILWTEDDIWFSGMLEKSGIKIRTTNKEKNETSSSATNKNDTDLEDDSLSSYVYKGFNRDDSICYGVKYFIDKYGIWKKYEKLSLSYLDTAKTKI